jgi:cation-transporting ATPase I
MWAAKGHAHIEIRRVDLDQVDRFAERLEKKLSEHHAVRWIEAVGNLGRVVVSFDEGAASPDEFVDSVEEVEEEFGVGEEPFAAEEQLHPADIEPIVRGIAEIGGAAIGVGVSTFRRLSRLPPLPLVGVAASALSVFEHQPRVRRLAEIGLGKAPAEVALAWANGLAQGVAGSPVGPLVDMAHRAALLTEAQARRVLWLNREEALWDGPSGHPRGMASPGPRPVPLPAGPIERYGDNAFLASLAGSGLTLATTRSLMRTAAVLQSGLPKAARYGREGFASHVGRVMASRGVLALDPGCLRLLDRVDCIVIDTDLLMKDEAELTEVIGIGPPPRDDDPERVARELFDRRDLSATVRRDGWELAPWSSLGRELPQGKKRRGQQLAKRGALLGLLNKQRLVALVGCEPGLRAGVEDVLAAARATGMQVVLAAPSRDIGARLPADKIVRGGHGLERAVRSLQREGHLVLVAAPGGSPGLPVADVGLGLRLASGPPPWGADLLAEDDDLTHIYLLIEACRVARAASRQAALVATGGGATAALASFIGAPSLAASRSMDAVNFASALSLLNGTRAAVDLSRRPVPVWREIIPWHELEVLEAIERLGTSAGGLSEEEASRRRPAVRPGPPGALTLARAIGAEMVNPLTPIMAAGAGLAVAVGSATDALLIGGVMVFNALIGGVERHRADRAIERLEASALQFVPTLRDDVETSVDARELVPGDVIRLRAGETVPADCRILEATLLEVDESSLTGESLPVPKGPAPSFQPALPDRSSMLFEGSAIASGEVVALVVATGIDTESMRSRRLPASEPPPSGLEARLHTLTSLAGPAALGSAGALAGLAVLRGAPVTDVVQSGVALSAAAVPEGLPLLATAAQMSAARRLAARGALVRSRRAVESLGRVDVACIDKTGTLTEGRITLISVSDGMTEAKVNADELPPSLRMVLAAGLRACSRAEGNGAPVSAEDRALQEGGTVAGVLANDGAATWRIEDELPFEPGRAYHAVLGSEDEDGSRLLTVKGAPEVVLEQCISRLVGDGPTHLTSPGRRRLMDEVHRLAKRGLRVLAVAEGNVGADFTLKDELVEGLTFVGFLAYADPVRPTAAAALDDVRKAGVDVVMMTGDHPSTAASIGAELELLDGKSVVTGPEIDAMDDDELVEALANVSVFARVAPFHKVRIVRAFQRAGRVVAMTGDGANDAQAIRQADVGIAFGERSTPAARDAADLVVVDERIETIAEALLEGRALWASARDAASILLGGNLGEVGFMVAGSALGRSAPLNARQLLLVNLLTDAAPALAIAVRQPRRPSPEQLVSEGPDASTGPLLRDIGWRAAVTTSGATGAWLAARMTGTRAHANTVGMAAVVGSQLGQTLLIAGRDPVVLAAGLGSAALMGGIVQTPGLSHLFGCRPLGPVGWSIAVTASGLATVGAYVLPKALSWTGSLREAADHEAEVAASDEEAEEPRTLELVPLPG